MVSANPNQLHIYDPETRGDTAVNLPKAPTSISVAPSGLYAAVGHDALISYVNLSNGTVERTYSVPGNVDALVLGSEYVYVLPAVSVKLSTGAVTGTSAYGVPGARLHPTLGAIYSTRDGTSPNDIERYEVSTGPITGHTDSVYHGDYAACGKIWFSADGNRIYNGCATVYWASADKKRDMYYQDTLPGVSLLVGLAESPTFKRIAVIPSTDYWNNAPNTEIRLFTSDYLQPAGSFAVPEFDVAGKKYKGSARWLFFSTTTGKLHALIQAEASSGMLNDFAVQTYSLTPSDTCAPSLSASSATAIGEGGIGSIDLTSTSDCVYQAVSDSSWLQVLSGGFASGNGKLTFLARPNAAAQSRSGAIRIGAQILTVTQEAAPAWKPFTRLPVNVVDVEYSKGLDRVVYVSATPNELHIFNPLNRTDTVVPLLRTPLCVSVRPDGLYAAVGHQGAISYVNLQSGTVERVYEILSDVSDLVLASNGYAYAFPERDWSDIYSLQLSTGAVTATSAIYEGRVARLHPNGKHIYAVGGGWSSKWDISAGPITKVPGEFSNCGNFWISESGDRLFTQCGQVYRSSEVRSEDLTYNGKLSDAARVQWAAHSALQRSTVVIPVKMYDGTGNDNELQVYGDEFLALAGKLPGPKFTVGASEYDGHGKFVFWNSSADKLFVVTQADSAAKLLSSFAIYTVSPDSSPDGCAVGLASSTADVAAAGGFGDVAVTSGLQCVWEAKSSAAWLTVTAGSLGFGSGKFSFKAAQNFTTTPRTAIITIGGKTFTVNQAAGSALTCQFALNASAVLASVSGQTSAVTLTGTPAQCPWTAASNSSWAQVFPLDGTGGGQISIRVFPNFSTAIRSATLTIAGKTLVVTQPGATGTSDERFIGQMYFNYFGRLASSAEIQYHRLFTLSGGKTWADLATAFLNTEEFNQGGRFVAGLYVALLNRDAEYGGWLFQRDALATNIVTQDSLVSNFMGSKEYALTFGSPTNQEFVRLLYRYVLLREASQVEVDFQANQLANGASRVTLARAFLNSAEFRNGAGPRLTAFVIYATVLLRGPSSAEFSQKVQQLQAGTAPSAIVAELIATPEFANLLR